ncbi:MAG: putative endonuclease 4 [Tepidiforma sp.]|uniref:deoxyribonuclease IV n=1 Tax=Tepidiforma sp. TaxID=2682230 RepID=UPI0021DEF7A2|nr:deoxyribonuclease IV [Tepidiforma sp.]GIW15488.1 MAG: putative endonuclease 4 [Tepidiforma sp.]
MRIGAHVSSAGGPHLAFERAASIGAEVVQLFVSAPQQWKLPALTPDQIARFNRVREASGMPAFFHGVYLMNFGSQDPAILEKSQASLRAYHRLAGELGVVGTIFHIGSHLGAGFDGAMVERIAGMLAGILAEEPDNPALLILENNAGQGNCIGGRFAELGAIVRAMGSPPNVGICFDTCHAYAMGYDIATPVGLNTTLEEFDRELGLQRLVAVHANDTKQPIGTFRDRHENIGEGHLGVDGFRTLMAHPAFAEVPFILEVPGFDGHGPDEENIRRLKQLREGLGLPAPDMPPIEAIRQAAGAEVSR